jgi:hypothetical protein
MAKNKCKWCGSSRHISKACSIKHKHQALLDGVPLGRCGFDVIMEIDFTKKHDVLPISYFSANYWRNRLVMGL